MLALLTLIHPLSSTNPINGHVASLMKLLTLPYQFVNGMNDCSKMWAKSRVTPTGQQFAFANRTA